MLAQLLTNWNNDTGSNPDEEENINNEHSKTENSNKSSSIDVDVTKDIKVQIASLTQQDELKKVGMTRPHPLEQDSDPYLPKFKSPLQISTFITSGLKLPT